MTSVSERNNTARTNILAKLKKQVSGADYSKLPAEPTYQYPILTAAEQLANFIGHLETNHAQVIKINAEDVAVIVAEQLKQRNINQLLLGKHSPTAEYLSQLDSSITKRDFDFSLNAKNQVHKNTLFNDIPASITSSRCAIAATGTIVLWPTVAEPRTLSLVPPVHFVIVDAQQMYSSFSTLIKEQQWQEVLPTNALLISGPSKTADIQQTLAYGAHGPKELIVLLINT